MGDRKTSEVQMLRLQCRQFFDRLIFVMVERVSMASSVSQCLSSFCPGGICYNGRSVVG